VPGFLTQTDQVPVEAVSNVTELMQLGIFLLYDLYLVQGAVTLYQVILVKSLK